MSALGRRAVEGLDHPLAAAPTPQTQVLAALPPRRARPEHLQLPEVRLPVVVDHGAAGQTPDAAAVVRKGPFIGEVPWPVIGDPPGAEALSCREIVDAPLESERDQRFAALRVPGHHPVHVPRSIGKRVEQLHGGSSWRRGRSHSK